MVIAGLISGRHDMPVETYIFDDKIENVHDYNSIREHINDFLLNTVKIRKESGIGINQNDGLDVEVFHGEKHLYLYVTGLTPVVAEVIAACARNGIELTLMNFDVATQEYIPQRLF